VRWGNVGKLVLVLAIGVLIATSGREEAVPRDPPVSRPRTAPAPDDRPSIAKKARPQPVERRKARKPRRRRPPERVEPDPMATESAKPEAVYTPPPPASPSVPQPVPPVPAVPPAPRTGEFTPDPAL
jgi:hypothetical protein